MEITKERKTAVIAYVQKNYDSYKKSEDILVEELNNVFKIRRTIAEGFLILSKNILA